MLSPRYRVDVTGYSAQSPMRSDFYFVNRDFDGLLKIEIELKSPGLEINFFVREPAGD